MEKKKLATASWGQPTLGIDCPYCGEWEDYFEQYADHEYPFEMLANTTRDNLKGIEFQCPECDEEFELEYVSW